MMKKILPADITLWVGDLAATTTIAGLCPEEIERANLIENPLTRQRYERTRSLTRRVLAAHLGGAPGEVKISVTAAGKPFLPDADGWEFSISHSKDLLIVAVGHRPIGVDVERRKPNANIPTLAERFFSPEDAGAVANAAPHDRAEVFIRQWVAKEAALKAAGCGLANALNLARCVSVEGEIREVTWSASHYSVRSFTLPDGTPGALAWEGAEEIALRWRDAAELSARSPKELREEPRSIN